MNLVKQGMNKEEAIENTVRTIFTSNNATIPVSEMSPISHIALLGHFPSK